MSQENSAERSYTLKRVQKDIINQARCTSYRQTKSALVVLTLAAWQSKEDHFSSFHKLTIVLLVVLAHHSFFASFTGINLQTTARLAPTNAIHTTETADGTRAPYCWKCSFANRNPKAEDFIAVSIAIVLHWVSVKFSARGMKYPASPPI